MFSKKEKILLDSLMESDEFLIFRNSLWSLGFNYGELTINAIKDYWFSSVCVFVPCSTNSYKIVGKFVTDEIYITGNMVTDLINLATIYIIAMTGIKHNLDAALLYLDDIESNCIHSGIGEGRTEVLDYLEEQDRLHSHERHVLDNLSFREMESIRLNRIANC